jgi:transposase InsO family protein
MDFIGPFPPSEEGYTWVLTMIDQFTRQAIFAPLKENTAYEAAKAINRHLITIGIIPQRIITDRGSQFLSGLFKHLCRTLKIKNLLTPAYHPKTTSQAERLNKVLKITLRAELAKAKNWVDLLPSLQFSTMVAYHQSLGTTPFEMVYGEPAMIPYDILFNPHHKLEKNTERKNLQQEDYITQLKQQIRQAHEFANQTQIEAAKIMKGTYDAKSRPAKPLIVGKQVYLYQPKIGKKGES